MHPKIVKTVIRSKISPCMYSTEDVYAPTVATVGQSVLVRQCHHYIADSETQARVWCVQGGSAPAAGHHYSYVVRARRTMPCRYNWRKAAGDHRCAQAATPAEPSTRTCVGVARRRRRGERGMRLVLVCRLRAASRVGRTCHEPLTI